jgi:hypothetical protein
MLLARRIADFVDRQYVSEEGDVRDNVESLFSQDLRYHTGSDILGREGLVAMGQMVRSTDKERRKFSLSDWEERGLTVRWLCRRTSRDWGPTGVMSDRRTR